jgi:hypothetical protein
MAIEDIFVRSKSDLIKSQKSGKTYFTVTNSEDIKFLCFDTTLYDALDKGTTMELEVTPGRNEQDTPRISRPKSQEEQHIPGQSPAPQELGMWWKELGECIRTGQMDKDYPKACVKIKHQYYKRMCEVTGVDFNAPKETK